jgi:hypothetical protein
MLKQNV